jgi:hypothetical protein
MLLIETSRLFGTQFDPTRFAVRIVKKPFEGSSFSGTSLCRFIATNSRTRDYVVEHII